MSCCIVGVVVQVNSEEPVYQAVLDWVKHDEKNRLIWLPSLLQFVRLPLLSACFITDVIDTEVRVCLPLFLSYLLSMFSFCMSV